MDTAESRVITKTHITADLIEAYGVETVQVLVVEPAVQGAAAILVATEAQRSKPAPNSLGPWG